MAGKLQEHSILDKSLYGDRKQFSGMNACDRGPKGQFARKMADDDFQFIVGRITTELVTGNWAAVHGIIDWYAHQKMLAERVAEQHVYERLSEREKLELPLAQTGLTMRTINALADHLDVLTVRELMELHPKEILEIDNVGDKTLSEIYAALGKLGFHREVE